MRTTYGWVGLVALSLAVPARPLHGEPLSAAVQVYRQGSREKALIAFLKIIDDRPGDPDAVVALHYVAEITRDIKRSEEALTFDESRWRASVAAARSIDARHVRDTQRLREEVASLARTLPTSKTPLEALRRAPLPLDDPDASQAEYLTTIRQGLEGLAQRPSANLADLHEMKGYLWLYKGDLELTVEEWAEAARLRAPDEAFERRLAAVRDRWKNQQHREEADHELQLGIHELRAGLHQEALDSFRKAASIAPGDEEIERYVRLAQNALRDADLQERLRKLTIRGRRQYDSGRMLESVQTWIEVIALDPANKEARRELERVKNRLLEREQPANPLPTHGAGALVPRELVKRAEESYSLGLIYYNDGELARAKTAFQASLASDPGHTKARQALDQVDRELGRR